MVTRKVESNKNLRLKARIVLVYGTQEDFSVATGIGRSDISRVVSGRWSVERATKAIYANRLECMIEEIF